MPVTARRPIDEYKLLIQNVFHDFRGHGFAVTRYVPCLLCYTAALIMLSLPRESDHGEFAL